MTQELAPQSEALVCAAHGAETYLRCNKCGTPICYRCTVQTPVGARCTPCAQLRRAPMYEVGAGPAAIAFFAALGVALLAGLIWHFIPGVSRLGWLIPIAIGYFAPTAIDRATGGKRGPVIAAMAAGTVPVAFLVAALGPNLLIWPDALLLMVSAAVGLLSSPNGLFMLLAIVFGAFLATTRVR